MPQMLFIFIATVKQPILSLVIAQDELKSYLYDL
jgi:hypothetical protein